MNGRSTLRASCKITALVPAVAAAFSSAAAANCDAALAQARAIAATITVDIEVPQRPRVGEPIKISWRKARDERPPTPTYLVLTTPAEVRFAGTGFMALTASAKGPHGLAHGSSSARAFVPLHRAMDAAKGGEIAVLPYRSGLQAIGWAVATAGACGEQVLGRGEQTIEVAAGPPEIVVQDRFATATPQERIRSRNGAYELFVFKDRYEIHEASTGAKVLDRPGTDPAFSPASRFIVARHAADGATEIVDLAAGKPMARLQPGTIAWAYGDSYFVHGSAERGEVRIWNAIVEGGELVASRVAGMQSDAAKNSQVTLNLNHGYVAAAHMDYWLVADLATSQIAPERAAIDDQLLRQGKSAELQTRRIIDVVRVLQGRLPATPEDGALRYIRQTYDPNLAALPPGWSFGEEAAPPTAQKFDSAATNSGSRLGARNLASPAATTPPNGRLKGQTLSSRGFQQAIGSGSADVTRQAFNMENATGIVFARLESAGVLTQPLHSINRVYVENAGGTGDAAPPIADLADRMRAEVPAAQRLFRSGSECFFEGEPADALLIDPQYITQVWRWRDVLGGNRWLLQTFCYPLMGRRVWGDLYELQGRTVRRLTAPLGEGALESFEATDELQVSKELKRLQIFRVHWGIFAVVVRAKNWTVLIDQLSGRSMGARIPLVDGALLAELRFTNDGRHLVQLNSDGRFFVHRVADGKRVLVGAHVDDEIVLANDDGLYDSTYEGAQAVQVRFPGMRGLHRYHQFEAALRRPGLAAAVLAGTAVPAPSAVPSPPLADLTLDAAAKSGRRGGTVIAAAERELSAVRLYVDGRLVTQLPAKGTRAEVMVDLPDPGGGRWISAVAVDARGLLSQPSAVQLPGKPAPRGTLRAVVVGVDAYEDRALPRLAYAKSDAQRFARALGASRGRTVQQLQTTSLLDAEVTPARVLAAVRAAAQATTPDDTLVIFYAGHGLDGRAGGQPDAGLVLTTPKTRMADLKSTALPWAALADALSEARGTIVVVLDACHAGIAGSDAFATNDDAVSALITRAGAPMVVLAGSKGRQLSHETPRAGGGLFTEAIAAVISEARASHDRDRSGLIDLGELYGAVKARVFEATKGQQTPWLARNALVGEMALF